ncbi:hypothetical protein F5I97DRAFT_2014472 [Phlebopus sp. FC_14]|nr:hypothetical protein F5I97DRAFT_2014472 [Phlebopus sp. FC_14]
MSTPLVPISDQYALNIGKQSRAGAVGLLIYERCIVLEDEVDLVWTKRKSWVTYLYFFNAWVGLIWLLFVLSRCMIYLLLDDVFTVVMTISVQAILQLRVWAIFGRTRTILYFLIALSLAEAAGMAALIGVTISDVASVPIVSTPTGCFFEGVLPFSAILWTPALVIEPILCALVVKKALGSIHEQSHLSMRSQGRIQLSVLLARDSLLYFFAVFLELLAATVIWGAFPHYISIIQPWSVAVPSLLGGRLLLNLRRYFDPVHSDTTTVSHMELTPYSNLTQPSTFIPSSGVKSRPDMPVFSPAEDSCDTTP